MDIKKSSTENVGEIFFATRKAEALNSRLSRFLFLVETEGFEPLTPRLRT